jgi:hypothetical protein
VPADEPERVQAWMRAEDRLHHVGPQLWVADPLELLQCLERREGSAEHPAHNVEHVALLICPVQPQNLDVAGKDWVCLDPVKNVQAAVEVLLYVLLVFSKMQVQCVENDAHCNIPVEMGYKKPCAEVVARNKTCNTIPDFRGRTVGCRLLHKMNLWSCYDTFCNSVLITYYISAAEICLKFPVGRVDLRNSLKVWECYVFRLTVT